MWLQNFAKKYIHSNWRWTYSLKNLSIFFWRGRSRIGARLSQWFCSIFLNFCVLWYRNPSLMGQQNITRSTETLELLVFYHFLKILSWTSMKTWIGLDSDPINLVLWVESSPLLAVQLKQIPFWQSHICLSILLFEWSFSILFSFCVFVFAFDPKIRNSVFVYLSLCLSTPSPLVPHQGLLH